MGDHADDCLEMEMSMFEVYGPEAYLYCRREEGKGPCPICGAETVLRYGKLGPFYGCSSFPKCRGTRNWVRLTREKLSVKSEKEKVKTSMNDDVKITREELYEWYDACEDISNRIDSRVDHVIRLIADTLNVKLSDRWSWIYSESYDSNTTWSFVRYDNVAFNQDEDFCVTLSIKGSYNFTESFPTEFLWTDDEKIVKLIKDELRTAQDKENKRMKRADKAKTSKQKLIEQALAKLTDKEKKALGVGT